MTTKTSNRGLSIALWIAQGLLALTLVGGAVWKFTTPIPVLAAKMPWMGQVHPDFLYLTAVLDLLGGLGVILPSLTRIRPQVTVLAAICCIALMLGAIVFHVQRGEAGKTPFNFFLIALAAFIAWGRSTKAPIAPR